MPFRCRHFWNIFWQFFWVKITLLAPKMPFFYLFRHQLNKNGSKWMKLSPIAWFFYAIQMQTFKKTFLTISLDQNPIFGPKNAVSLSFQASIEQEWLKVDETKSYSIIFRCHSDAAIFKNFFGNFLGSKSHFLSPKSHFSIF